MKRPRMPGILRVTQRCGGTHDEPKLLVRDFAASEWTPEWIGRYGISVLRVSHDNVNDFAESFDFVEFSSPVQIEFIAQEEDYQ